MKVQYLLLLFCFSSIVHSQLTPDVQALVDLMASMRNSSADPCTDFYEYACGAFVASHPVPANVSGPYLSVPAIDAIGYNNDALLAKIVLDPWPIVNDMYQSCMQPTSAVDNQLKQFFLRQVKYIDNFDITTMTELYSVIVELANHGAFAFIYPEAIVTEYQIPEIYLSAYGNTLGADDYDNSTLYNELLRKVTAAFELFESSTTAQQNAINVLKIEHYIAVNNVNTSSNGQSTNMTVMELSQMTNINYTVLLNQMGIVCNDNTFILIENPGFFQNLSSITTAFPTTSVQRFFQWKIYSAYSSYYVSSCWNNPNPPTICSVIMGNSPFSPPWDQASVCRNLVHNYVQDLVGLIFTYEIVTPEVTESIKNMTTGIQQSFNKSLPSLTWLDDYSLESVIFKLDHVIQIIGHPNIMDRYENVTTSPNEYFTNIWNILGATIPFGLTQSTVPFNRSDFEFDPMIVNAFYDPSTNTINFPAGMLEGPMFSGSWPKLFQYSRFGIVVGHENTHGFDNQGSYWDAFGLPGDILDAATRANFLNSAVCIADFYGDYVVYGNTTIPGNHTLGENIADIGGIKNSYRAYQAYVAQNGEEYKDYQLLPDLTTDQVYFLHYGQTWCSTSNQAWLEYQLQYDVHSPAKFRVNGPLTQFDEFASAFNCPANSPMNPPSRCNLW